MRMVRQAHPDGSGFGKAHHKWFDHSTALPSTMLGTGGASPSALLRVNSAEGCVDASEGREGLDCGVGDGKANEGVYLRGGCRRGDCDDDGKV